MHYKFYIFKLMLMMTWLKYSFPCHQRGVWHLPAADWTMNKLESKFSSYEMYLFFLVSPQLWTLPDPAHAQWVATLDVLKVIKLKCHNFVSLIILSKRAGCTVITSRAWNEIQKKIIEWVLPHFLNEIGFLNVLW